MRDWYSPAKFRSISGTLSPSKPRKVSNGMLKPCLVSGLPQVGHTLSGRSTPQEYSSCHSTIFVVWTQVMRRERVYLGDIRHKRCERRADRPARADQIAVRERLGHKLLRDDVHDRVAVANDGVQARGRAAPAPARAADRRRCAWPFRSTCCAGRPRSRRCAAGSFRAARDGSRRTCRRSCWCSSRPPHTPDPHPR